MINKKTTTTFSCLKQKKKENMFFKMVLFIKGSGKGIKDTDMEFRYGLMVLSMKDSGKIIKLMVKVRFIMLMEIFLKGNGKMIKLMEEECINMLMVQNMKEIGKMIYKKDQAQRFGLMDHNTKGNTVKDKSMGTESMSGMMDQLMKDNGLTIKLMEQYLFFITLNTLIFETYQLTYYRDFTNGQMEESIMVSGVITRCMEQVCTTGLMGDNTRDNIKKTKRKDTGFIIGQMEEYMKDSGSMENSMEKANIRIKAGLLNLEYGRTVRGLNG